MKILVFVSEYPPKGNTAVIHYFLREWVDKGVEVHVIYNYSRLIFPLYKFVSQQDKRFPPGKPEKYEIDGVKVFSIPSKRFVPRKNWILPFSKIYAKKILRKYIVDNVGEDFDAIINHFCTNNYWLVESVVEKYKCMVFSVFHDCDIRNEKLAKRIIDNSYAIGARSKKISRYLFEKIGYRKEIYNVISGVPTHLINGEGKISEKKEKLHLIYVGKLIKRKHVDVIISALHLLEDKIDYIFDIVGDGLEKESLESLVKKYGMNHKVFFYGNVNRIKVFELMKKADCFVMLSTEETLGLVYLEAMANGNIVIGTRGEGIDGIIIDSVNGFLVEAGNIDLLSHVIYKIAMFSDEERKKILESANKTVNELRDDLVADRYKNNIEYLVKKFKYQKKQVG